MDLKSLLFKRILVVEKTYSYSSESTTTELKILEISPSGEWVKIQNMTGQKYWKHYSDIKPIEILFDIEKPKM
jgi:hypothetical protein